MAKVNGIPFYTAVEVNGNKAYNSKTKGFYIRTAGGKCYQIGSDRYEFYVLPLAEMKHRYGIIMPEPVAFESVGAYYRRVKKLACTASFKDVKTLFNDEDKYCWWHFKRCIRYIRDIGY